MSIALSEFWTRLVRSGITDANGCKQLAAAFSKANRGTPPSDSRSLADFMVGTGSLTSFQVDALLADPPRELKSGHFLIRSDRGPMPLSRWIPVARLDDRRSGLLFRISNEQMAGGREPWLQAHQEVLADGLQTFEYEKQQAWTLVFSELPKGQCLHDLLTSGKSLDPRLVCQLGITISQALAAMHQRPLIHGAVRADHVWIDEHGGGTLLRDPSGPPEWSGGGTNRWLDDVERPDFYAAPEFARSGQDCGPETDIYSLGCLLFRLISGRYPIEGASVEETLAAHAAEMPPELAEAVAKGESGDPFYRVIAFAMAKSPSARFTSAAQLTNALRAILPLIAGQQSLDSAKSAEISRGETPEVSTKDKTAASRPVSKPEASQSTSSDGDPRPKTSTKPIASGNKSSKKQSKVAKPGASEKAKVEVSQPSSNPTASKRPTQVINASETHVTSAEKPKRVSSPRPTEPSTPSTKQHSAINSGSPETVQPTPPHVVGDKQEGPPSPKPSDHSESTPSRPVRSRRKKKSKAPLVLGGMMCVVVLMLLIVFAVPSRPAPEPEKPRLRPRIPDVIPAVTNVPKSSVQPEPGPKVAGYELVTDTRLLFVPPYPADTKTASLELLPPGPAVILAMQLESILKSRLGSDLVAVLSPELKALISQVSQRAKVPVESIANCSVALHPGKEGWPEASLAITLTESVPAKDLLDKWQVSASRTSDGATIYAGDTSDGDAFYFQDNADDSILRFAVGSIEQISEVAAAEGGAVPLPRSSQTLWSASSDQADVVALISPNFLFADGREMLASSAPELVAPLRSALQPDVAAMLITLDFEGDQLFAETRLAPSGGISEAALLQSLRDRIDQWPAWADEFIVDSVPDPSWRLLASRLPSMMRFVVDQVRFGISDGAVVANTYLPPQAVPQVTLATLLAMNTPSGNSVIVSNPKTKRSLTVDEMLDRPMSVSFDQESLEFAIDSIVGAFTDALPSGSTMPPVRIIGGDLQLMGITQNQQVRDFSKSEVPLRQVLTDLVLGANPDKTATGPNDEKQALIWVVADDDENPGKKVILVTTRQAAKGKYELPKEFISD